MHGYHIIITYIYVLYTHANNFQKYLIKIINLFQIFNRGILMRLKDIAQIAGVSIKTVSRALNNYPDISKETKERILGIAKELHYIPNSAAKSLRENRSFSVGLILPDITNVFFGEVGMAVHNYLKKSGYSTLISFSEGKHQMEIESLDMLLSKQVDGIILATVGSTGERVREILTQEKIPIVVIDNEIKNVKTNMVMHHNYHHAYTLTEHLINQGCKQIGCICGPSNQSSSEKRFEGFVAAMNDYHIPINKRAIIHGDWTISGGRFSCKTLLKQTNSNLDALIVSNSLMAIGVYDVLKKAHLQIPNDIAVASFDYLDILEALDPPLTTFSKIDSTIGELAAKELLFAINHPQNDNIRYKLVTAELKVRESTMKRAF